MMFKFAALDYKGKRQYILVSGSRDILDKHLGKSMNFICIELPSLQSLAIHWIKHNSQGDGHYFVLNQT